MTGAEEERIESLFFGLNRSLFARKSGHPELTTEELVREGFVLSELLRLICGRLAFDETREFLQVVHRSSLLRPPEI